jgi:hypothetical protein
MKSGDGAVVLVASRPGQHLTTGLLNDSNGMAPEHRRLPTDATSLVSCWLSDPEG